MGFGVLEDLRNESVPGTVFLNNANDTVTSSSSSLKLGTGRNSHLVLVPQPSDDPNDPLLWPQWRKEFCLFIVSAITGVASTVWIMLSPGQIILAEEFNVTLTEVSKSTGVHILITGAGTIVTNSLATKFGKRPVFLACALVLLVTNIWGALARSWGSFFAARAVMGIGVAPFETIVTAMVSDIYFVHERATRNSFWNCSLGVGSTLGAVIGGYVIQDLGWRWTFGICAIAMGVLTPALFFLVPETVFIRENKFNIDILKRDASENDESHNFTGASGTRKPLPQTLKPWSDLITPESYIKLIIRPVFMCAFPAVIWACFVYATTVTWLSLISLVQSQIFSSAPYNMTPSAIGLTFLGSLLTGIAGNATGGPLVDYIAVRMSSWNKGIYEPEFRLPLAIPGTVFSVLGLFGFGWAIERGLHWVVPTVFNAIYFLGLVYLSIPVYGYVVDAHREYAPNAFVLVNTVKAIASYVLSFHANDWYSVQGPKLMFYTLGSIQLGCCITTLILYIFGKRLRSSIARNKYLSRI